MRRDYVEEEYQMNMWCITTRVDRCLPGSSHVMNSSCGDPRVDSSSIAQDSPKRQLPETRGGDAAICFANRIIASRRYYSLTRRDSAIDGDPTRRRVVSEMSGDQADLNLG